MWSWRRSARQVLIALVAVLCTPAPGWAASAKASGNRTLLYMRIDFSDLPGEPISETDARKVTDQVEKFYSENSFGKLKLKTTITPVLRVPEPFATYLTKELAIEARAVAKSKGLNPAKFDFDAAIFRAPAGQMIQVGAMNGKSIHLGNAFHFGGLAHELGHNLGLPHAEHWNPSDGFGAGVGERYEYGDWYDIMGAAQVDNLRCHISGPQKNALGWLGPNGVVGAAGETGTYRIYASDVAGPAPASVSPRLLRVQRNAKEIYWVEFRQLFPEDAYLTNSVRLLRSFSKGPVVYSLDATGDSPLGRADGGIMLGKTYEDAEAGVYITPIGKGGTEPESVDVVVKRGKFSGNRAPVLKTKSRVIETTKDEIVSFQVEASDPDGDELQYAWDFGDQRFDWAKPKVTHRWPNDENRQFVVRCVVTDMKGGTASVSWPVVVGKPKNGWIRGVVKDEAGKPVADARVEVDWEHSAQTDSDGTFTLVRLRPGEYSIWAHKRGFGYDAQGVQVQARPTESDPMVLVLPKAAEDGSVICEAGITVTGERRLGTPKAFKPPCEIEIVAKTNADLRIGYAAEQIVFNWENNKSELRVDGGPGSGARPGAGQIPTKKDVTIRWLVTPKNQTVFVDGTERFTHEGDYSKLDRLVTVFGHNSVVTVKSIRVSQLPGK